jgi:hypothetical protein
MTPEEGKVFSALDNPEWEWRTIEALARDTSLTIQQLFEIIGRHWDKLNIFTHPEKGLLLQLKERTIPFHEGTVERVLDYFSAGGSKL